jgi:hypothetical protein
MSDALQPGQTYWSLVEPEWLRLNRSWDEDPREFIRQYKATPIEAGHLYAAHWCQSEVNNGGLHQFFYNTTGILAPEALAGLHAIGVSEWSEILREAMAFFGNPYPRERSVRLKLLPKSDGRKRKEWDPFGAFDDRFYDWLEDDFNRWYRLADKYVDSG